MIFIIFLLLAQAKTHAVATIDLAGSHLPPQSREYGIGL
jgi:hypothetical protein